MISYRSHALRAIRQAGIHWFPTTLRKEYIRLMISIEARGNIIELFFQTYSLLDFLAVFSCQKKRNCYYIHPTTAWVFLSVSHEISPKKNLRVYSGHPWGGFQVPRANMYMGSVELINRKIASIEGHFGPSTVTWQQTGNWRWGGR